MEKREARRETGEGWRGNVKLQMKLMCVAGWGKIASGIVAGGGVG